MATPDTVIHLVRHGEVHNPDGVLYGRRPGFHLSDLGRQMAEKVAGSFEGRDIARVVCSPLDRTRDTAEPIALAHGVEIETDERVIESTNKFEGHAFGPDRHALKDVRNWRHLWNPFRPSWGEPYADIVARMKGAITEVRDSVEGREAVIVSHQLPIWVTRMHAEKRRTYVHDPRRRQCTLCSVTSLRFVGDRVAQVSYSEPAGDLIPVGDRSATFSAGGAPEETKPT